MIRLWRRRRAARPDPVVARRDAECRRSEAIERWPEVREVTEPLRQAQRENHFAELFEDIGGGREC